MCLSQTHNDPMTDMPVEAYGICHGGGLDFVQTIAERRRHVFGMSSGYEGRVYSSLCRQM